MSKRLHQRLIELSTSLATFDDDGELSFGEDSHLVIEALKELKMLRLENRRLRGLITEWADAERTEFELSNKECGCDQRYCTAARALRKAVGR